jgi:O-antigen/teichoic acid export membrane protein
LLAALLSPAVALFAGLAAVWVPVVFGPKWPNLPLLLLIMAPAQLVTAVFWGILNPAMIVAGKQRAIAGFLAVLTLVYAASTWLLTIWWGAYGVAVALSLSYVSLFPFLFRLYRRTHGPLPLGRPLTEIVIATGFMLALWFANGHVGPIGLLCAAYVAIWSFRNSDLLKRAGQLMAQLRVATRVPATEEI